MPIFGYTFFAPRTPLIVWGLKVKPLGGPFGPTAILKFPILNHPAPNPWKTTLAFSRVSTTLANHWSESNHQHSIGLTIGIYFFRAQTWCLPRERIEGGQWRHKITIYGRNGLSVYIHIWQISVVTNHQLFESRY